MTYEGIPHTSETEELKPLSEQEEQELKALRTKQIESVGYGEEDRKRLIDLQSREKQIKERRERREEPLDEEEIVLMKKLERDQTDDVDWSGEKAEDLDAFHERYKINLKK